VNNWKCLYTQPPLSRAARLTNQTATAFSCTKRWTQKSVCMPFCTLPITLITPPIKSTQWLRWIPSSVARRLRHDAYQSPSQNAKLKNMWSYTASPPHVFVTCKGTTSLCTCRFDLIDKALYRTFYSLSFSPFRLHSPNVRWIKLLCTRYFYA
jgi:hypothetical protein